MPINTGSRPRRRGGEAAFAAHDTSVASLGFVRLRQPAAPPILVSESRRCIVWPHAGVIKNSAVLLALLEGRRRIWFAVLWRVTGGGTHICL